jgi:hypothetical protein
VCLLLDSVGFSNYVFKRLESESDPVIPYFFIPPDQSVAEILSGLARATQSAMFFDEFNNFVVSTKKYLLDDSNGRAIDTTLYGSDLVVNKKIIRPANIISIGSKDKKVYNSGTINYTSRYIDRTGGTIKQSKFVDKTYVYKPSLLWEVSGTERTRSANDDKTERFALSAVPLNTNLSNEIPVVSADGIIINNVFDIGENAYWLSKYQGLFVANGEIIKYDAVEFDIAGTGKIWISSRLEYLRYFSEIPFNGKMYPTGLVRIYAEPFFETISGTTITVKAPPIIHPVSITTDVYPGFPTDLQAQWATAMTLANGKSVITDTIYTDRFSYVPELNRLGASLEVKHNSVHVNGKSKLSGASIMSTDLRASVSLVMAALVAEGTTEVLRVYHLDRGYEFLEKKLTAVGANIKRGKE